MKVFLKAISLIYKWPAPSDMLVVGVSYTHIDNFSHTPYLRHIPVPTKVDSNLEYDWLKMKK